MFFLEFKINLHIIFVLLYHQHITRIMFSSFKAWIKSLAPTSSYHSLNTIEINQSHILHNFHELQTIQPNHTIIPVVKSNAYGHGLKQICTILNTLPNNKLPLIAVDSYPEYQIVTATTTKSVLVLWETFGENYHLYNPKRTHIAVGSIEVLQSLITTNKQWNIHLFLNTGMNREWFQPENLQQALKLLSDTSHITVIGIMSHLANADLIDNDFTHQQIEAFKTMSKSILNQWHKPLYIHISNSAWLSKIQDDLFTASRSGLALYGYNPLDPQDQKHNTYKNLKPALRLTSTITSIQYLKLWEGVNYGLSWITDKETFVATLPIGYNEWLPRLTGQWWYHVYHSTTPLPIIGKVCMNLSSIELWQHKANVGDSIEVIWRDQDKDNTIQQLAKINNIIPYNILTSLYPNIKRIIR